MNCVMMSTARNRFGDGASRDGYMITNCYFCDAELDTEEDDVHTDPETSEDCCADCCPKCNPEKYRPTVEDFLISHPSSCLITGYNGYKIYYSHIENCWVAKNQGYETRTTNLDQLMETVSKLLTTQRRRKNSFGKQKR